MPSSATIRVAVMIEVTASERLAAFAEGLDRPPPPRLGIRYDREGRFLAEPGNTVVCHVEPNSPERSALIAARDRLRAMPEADRFAFTPVDSLHMTLFQGILDTARDASRWPDDLDRDASVSRATEHFLRGLSDFAAPPSFAMRPVEMTPAGLVLEGATPDDDRALRQWRDALAEALRLRHPDHDGYVFHVTFAYPIAWLPHDRLRAWGNVLTDTLADIVRATPVMTFAPPAFCHFDDMCRFHEVKRLGGRSGARLDRGGPVEADPLSTPRHPVR